MTNLLTPWEGEMFQWCLHKRMMWCLSTGGADVGLEATLQCFDGNDAYPMGATISLILFTWQIFHRCMFMELLTLQTIFRRCQQWWSDALHNMNHAVVARRSSEVSGELISATTWNVSASIQGVKYDVTRRFFGLQDWSLHLAKKTTFIELSGKYAPGSSFRERL